MARKPLDPDQLLAANQAGTVNLSPEEAYAARTNDLKSPAGSARAGFTSFGERPPVFSGLPVAAAQPAVATRPGANSLVDSRTGRPAFTGVSDSFVKSAAGLTTTRGQSVQEAADQDAFDKAHGFAPTVRATSPVKRPQESPLPNAMPAVQPVIAGATPISAPVTRSPLDVLSGIPASTPFNADLSGTIRPSQLDPAVLRGTPPSGAEVAGAKVRSAVGNVVDPAIAGLGKAEMSTYDTLIGRPVAAAGRAVAGAGRAVAGFGRGLLGRSTAAGVSNSSVAQFEQPTKANPVPKTPTTPTANIDRSENAIGRFGLSDAEFNRRKFAFAGF